MINAEKKFWEKLEVHIDVVIFAVITIVGFLIRFSLRYMISGDAEGFLLPWYETIRDNGGLRSMAQQVGDYNLLYQFLIALMTYLPIPALYLYKGMSIFFDYVLAFVTARLVYEMSSGGIEGKKYALLTYGMVIMSPIVILNSSAWAQCDSIYVSFLMLTLLELYRGREIHAYIWLGIAFGFKLQAIFLLPFCLYLYVRRKKHSIAAFLIIPGVFFLTGLPGLLYGRSLWETVDIYIRQSGKNPILSGGYPSFWTVVASGDLIGGYYHISTMTIWFAIAVLAGWMLFWIRTGTPYEGNFFVTQAFLLSYTCVLFLPAMHERYGYFYEILAIVVLFVNRNTFLPMMGMYLITLVAYGNFLFGQAQISPLCLAVANVIVYVLYGFFLTKQRIINIKDQKRPEGDESDG